MTAVGQTQAPDRFGSAASSSQEPRTPKGNVCTVVLHQVSCGDRRCRTGQHHDPGCLMSHIRAASRALIGGDLRRGATA